MKLILSLLALILGAIFALIYQQPNVEIFVVGIISAIASAFGIIDWRQKYNLSKKWFKSKTIVSAIVVAVSVILVMTLPFLIDINQLKWLIDILELLIIGGGGGVLYGIFDATKNGN